MYHYLWYFFVYAFLGWCSEVCFAALKNGRFVNRGFLNGPWCPIYGCGLCIVICFLTPLRQNAAALFAGSVLLTSALEFLTGFLLEKLFHQKWWDYSDMPFNIGGYICPLFSVLWGLACLLVMDIVHPAVHGLVSAVPHTLGVVLLCVLSFVMLTDLAATVSTILRLNRKLQRLDELAARIRAASDDIGSALSERTLSLAEKGAEGRSALEQKKAEVQQRREQLALDLAQRRELREDALQRRAEALRALRKANEDLLATYHFGQKRLLRAFPRMRSTRHAQALEQMKQRLKNEKKK